MKRFIRFLKRYGIIGSVCCTYCRFSSDWVNEVVGTHYVDGETKVSLAYDRSFYAKGDMRLIIGAEYTFYFYDGNWHIGCLIDEIAWRSYQEDLEQ